MKSQDTSPSPTRKFCIDKAAMKAGVVCGYSREGEECHHCEIEPTGPGLIFIDGDFNNSYESKIRASKSKNKIHKS